MGLPSSSCNPCTILSQISYLFSFHATSQDSKKCQTLTLLGLHMPRIIGRPLWENRLPVWTNSLITSVCRITSSEQSHHTVPKACNELLQILYLEPSRALLGCDPLCRCSNTPQYPYHKLLVGHAWNFYAFFGPSCHSFIKTCSQIYSPPHLEAVQPGSDKDSGAPDTSVPVLRQVFVQGRFCLAEQSSSPQPEIIKCTLGKQYDTCCRWQDYFDAFCICPW